MRIGRLRGPCSAKRSLEMKEESDWSRISRSDQRSYINARSHASGAVSEILVKYGSEFLATDTQVPGSIPGATRFSE